MEVKIEAFNQLPKNVAMWLWNGDLEAGAKRFAERYRVSHKKVYTIKFHCYFEIENV